MFIFYLQNIEKQDLVKPNIHFNNFKK